MSLHFNETVYNLALCLWRIHDYMTVSQIKNLKQDKDLDHYHSPLTVTNVTFSTTYIKKDTIIFLL